MVDPAAPISPDRPDIQLAAHRLRAGELVAFPTETVYGLGADALNPSAVARVFATKGRPSHNPLIVHVASIEMAQSLAREWPREADTLARAFWPGPLTIVVPKADHIPDAVTARGSTVALRRPAHRLAQALLDAFAGPLVGPSANKSGHVSPTTAAHVRAEFGDAIPVLDGGLCIVGLESTVVAFDGGVPRILRPGAISAAQIAHALAIDPASISIGSKSVAHHTAASPLQSPGLLASHYAPRTPLIIVDRADATDATDITTVLPNNASQCARGLYAMLRDADQLAQSTGAARIAVVVPLEALANDHDPLWDAILDRLRRAAAPRDESA